MRRAIAAPCALLIACGTGTSEVREPVANRYPRVVEDQASPPAVVRLTLGPNCKRPQFSAVVEDPDLSDGIRSRWFVDPDQGFSTLAFAGTLTSVPSKTSLRDAPIKAPEQPFAAGSRLSEPGEHRLVLVIADGEFEQGIQTAPRMVELQDGGVRFDPTFTDSHTWFVTTDVVPCQ
jgi:hypothetical protein